MLWIESKCREAFERTRPVDISHGFRVYRVACARLRRRAESGAERGHHCAGRENGAMDDTRWPPTNGEPVSNGLLIANGQVGDGDLAPRSNSVELTDDLDLLDAYSPGRRVGRGGCRTHGGQHHHQAHTVATVDDVQRTLATWPPGRLLTLTVIRGQQRPEVRSGRFKDRARTPACQ
jgi:hypothetical protein